MRITKIFLGVVIAGLMAVPLYFSGIGGCGGDGTRAATDDSGGGTSTTGTLDMTVALSSGSSASLSALALPGTKHVTRDSDETVQADITVECYNLADDSLLGSCTTGSDGSCNPTTSLTAGEYNVICRALKTDVEVGCFVSNFTIAAGGTQEAETNAGESTACYAWRASAEEQSGETFVFGPSGNGSRLRALVDPGCMRDAFISMMDAVDDDVIGADMVALKEAQKENQRQFNLSPGRPRPCHSAWVMC